MLRWHLTCLCPPPTTTTTTATRLSGLVAHHDALRSQLQQEPYRLLLNHAAAQLGPSALPTLRDMLQVGAGGSPAPAPAFPTAAELQAQPTARLAAPSCGCLQTWSGLGFASARQKKGAHIAITDGR